LNGVPREKKQTEKVREKKIISGSRATKCGKPSPSRPRNISKRRK